MDPVALLPDDGFNRKLAANVHPPGWRNPTPDGRYNLVVVGAGTAGLVTAAVAAGLGARVALVERHLMGGDCLNVGCVPSKGVLRAARVWASARDGAAFGLTFPGGVERDFGAAMARMRRLRAEISHVDSAERFAGLGVDVFIGEGRFTGPDTVAVGDAVLRFARAAVCTGARAAALPIPGLADAGCLTNETVFSLTELPPRLAVIGAGPIGCELAQAFARFGSEVTVLEQAGRILPREDPDAAAVVQARMAQDGVRFALDARDRRGGAAGRGQRGEAGRAGFRGRRRETHPLHRRRRVARGECRRDSGRRRPGPERRRAGSRGGRRGLRPARRHRRCPPADDQPPDLCGGRHLFSVQVHPCGRRHGPDRHSERAVPAPLGAGQGVDRVAGHSLVHLYRARDSPTSGCTEADARAKGIEVETFTQPLAEVDRAVLDGEDAGFARVHVRRGTDRILGATVVAADAGNLISEVSVAMKAGAGLGVIGSAIHPYPTQAEAWRKAANQMRRARFSDRQRAILSRLFAWRR